MKKRFYLLLFLFFISQAIALAQTAGKLIVEVTSVSGKPLKAAYVKLVGKDTTLEAATKNGKFYFTVPKAGIYQFWAGGVHHRAVSFPLLLEQPTQSRIKIKLATIPYLNKLDTVLVTGNFNNYFLEEGLVPMTRGKDGQYRATIYLTSDTLAYYLLGVQKHWFPQKAYLEGTQAHHFSYNASRPDSRFEAGKFISVVKTRKGKATINFNPQDLPHSSLAPSLSFSDPDSRMARIASIAFDLGQRGFIRYTIGVKSLHIRKKVDAPDEGWVAPTEDLAQEHAGFIRQIHQEQDTLIRNYLLFKYFARLANEAKPEVAHQFLREVSPTSKVWLLEPEESSYVFSNLFGVLGFPAEANAYLLRLLSVYKGHPVLWPNFLYQALYRAASTGNQDLVKQYYYQLINEFPDSKDAMWARKRFDPEKSLAKGMQVPYFSLSSLDDPKVTITADQFKGKVYLIDFWGTWCSPCIQALPEMEELYQKYKEKGFAIVSIAVDDTPEKISSFRKKRYPMPWFHALAKEGYNDPVAKSFKLVGLPWPILVDEQGTILGTYQLANGGLREILTRYFNGEVGQK